MKRYPAIQLNAALTIFLVIPAAAFITVLALWCQPNELEEILPVMRETPLLFLVNFLPVGVLLLAAACFFQNVFIGACLTDFLVCGLSVANRVKIMVRDEPVFPRDLSLLKEVFSAMGHYDIQFPVGEIAAVILSSLLFLLVGLFVGSKPFPSKQLPGFFNRLLGTGVSLGVLAFLLIPWLGDDALYNQFTPSNPYRLSVVFNENGFPYSFCRQFTKFLVDKPAGYSRSRAVAWDEEVEPVSSGKDVHVIVIMNEAFSDITDDPAFAFSEEDDPLSHLHVMKAEEHALSLRLVVPGFAGGTANTEFDVLTGMQTNSLGETTTSAMRTVNRNLDSVFRVFRDDGYHTAFYHPGNDWFYNRENVYRWLGAEETLFIDQMYVPIYKGSWVTDDYMAGLIESAFETAVSEGQFLFHYTTTIQNHMGYPRSKYGEGYEFPPVPLNVSVSEEVRSMLEVYTEGVRDADAMLGRLRDYFAASTEPVVLAFFGDHLPYLGDERQCYAALGMDIAQPDETRVDYFCIYETPCVIWANDAAAAALDWEAVAARLDLPANGKLSAAYLGTLLLEITGRRTANAWTAFLNTLRRQAPVVQRNVFMAMDGTAGDLDAVRGTELDSAIQKWRQWSYYKLEQKELS